MNGLTNYITERPWEDTITALYVYVDDAYQRVMQRYSAWQRQSGPAPSFTYSEVITLVDSAPVTVVTYPWGGHCKSVVRSEYFEVVTSKKGKVYGLRLHITNTVAQLIDDWALAPASIRDPEVLDELVLDRRDLILIGDKIYTTVRCEAIHSCS